MHKSSKNANTNQHNTNYYKDKIDKKVKSNKPKQIIAFTLVLVMILAMAAVAFTSGGAPGNRYKHNANSPTQVGIDGGLADSENKDVFPVYPDSGAVYVNKTAGWVDTEYVKVALDIIGIPKQKGVDVVLVLDSTSSLHLDGLASLQAAANNFIGILMDPLIYTGIDGVQHTVHNDNRLSIVTFKENQTKKETDDINQSERYFYTSSTDNPDNISALHAIVNNLELPTSGVAGTNYVIALDAARENIVGRSDDSRDVFVVFMSDGRPTDPDDGLIGSAKLNDAITAIKNVVISGNGAIYTVGFRIDNDGADLLDSMALDPGYYVGADDDTTLNTAFTQIAKHFKEAGTDAVIGDYMSEYFDLVVDVDHPITLTPSTAGTVTYDTTANSITWDLGSITESGARIEYYVKIKHGTPVDESYPTNKEAIIEYTNYADDECEMYYQEPYVPYPGGQIRVVGIRVNSAGTPFTTTGFLLDPTNIMLVENEAKIFEYYWALDAAGDGYLKTTAENLEFDDYDVKAPDAYSISSIMYDLLNGGAINSIPTGAGPSVNPVAVHLAGGPDSVQTVYFGYCPKAEVYLRKVDADTGDLLGGAKFSLDGLFVIETDSTTVNSLGFLADGIHTLDETTAPDGYEDFTDQIEFLVQTNNLNTNQNVVTITAGNNSVTLDNDGKTIVVQNTKGVFDYTVEYYYDDTTGTPFSTAGGSETFNEKIPYTLDGSALAGFDALYDPDGTKASGPDVITSISANNVVKIVFIKKPGYNVNYDVDGDLTAVIDPDNPYYVDDTITVVGDVPVKNGYVFVGWLYDNHIYGDGDTLRMPAHDITLVAEWQPEPPPYTYTVVFDPGTQGTWAAADETYDGLLFGDAMPAFGAKSGAGTYITKTDGYVFIGWLSSNDTTSTLIKILPQTVTENVTYTAQWEYVGDDTSKPPTVGGGGGGTSTSTIVTPAPTPEPTPTPRIIEEPEIPAGPLFISDHVSYIIGYPDGLVRPEQNVTRAEVATVFFRLLTEERREEYWSLTNPYPDALPNGWYNTGVSVMNKMGAINGYPDGTFRPDDFITRAELAAISARFARTMGVTGDNDTTYTDIAGHWAEDDIMHVTSIGWVGGYLDETFKPDQMITRAEFMTLVNNVLERFPEKLEDILYDDMLKWDDNMDTSAWYYLIVQEATNSHIYEKKAGQTIPGKLFEYETWTNMRAPLDWLQLEQEWIAQYSTND